MLQQTQVNTVIPYWQRWMRELPTVEAAAKASPAKLHKLWEGLGYYIRVRNLQKAARQIIEKHGGKFPENFDDVLSLPGIGRYTAGAVCSIAFNQPTPILDGNVTRVLTRIFGVIENVQDKQINAKLWQLAERLVRSAARNPHNASRITLHASQASHLNQSLMELGALICAPKQPKCNACPVRRYCVAHRTGRISQIPNFRKRARSTTRHFIALVAQRKRRFLVRQRPPGGVNEQLWEFPNFELLNGSDLNRTIKRTWGIAPASLQPLCMIKHSITRYRITLQAFRAQLKMPPGKTRQLGRWLTRTELEQLAFASAHKKILARLSP